MSRDPRHFYFKYRPLWIPIWMIEIPFETFEKIQSIDFLELDPQKFLLFGKALLTRQNCDNARLTLYVIDFYLVRLYHLSPCLQHSNSSISTTFTHLFLPSISAQNSCFKLQSDELRHSSSLFGLCRQTLKNQSKCKICLYVIMCFYITIRSPFHTNTSEHIFHHFCTVPYCNGNLSDENQISHKTFKKIKKYIELSKTYF